MASLGQEVYAVDNGVMWRQIINGETNSTLSGNAWYVKLPDGTYYFYGHLSAFATGVKLGDPVTAGPVDRVRRRHGQSRARQLSPALRGAPEGWRSGQSVPVADHPQVVHGRALRVFAAK